MKWYIDYSGYCIIEAKTREEVEEKFWAGLRPPTEDSDYTNGKKGEIFIDFEKSE